MKRVGAAVVVCILAGMALLLVFRNEQRTTPIIEKQIPPPAVRLNEAQTTANGAILTNDAPAAGPQSPPAVSASNTQTAPDTAAQTETNLPQETILQNIRRAVHQYGDTFGGNPVGTNPEITAALNGHNPKQINFLRDEPGVRINASGEMIDSWGTPYFFHQLSAHDMEIHSAGPDKIMWTSDDLVTQ